MSAELFWDKYRIASARLPGRDYSISAYYFVTICTKDRIPWFGEIKNGEMILNDIGKIAHDMWLKIPNHSKNVKLDSFVIMPDHVHGILFLQDVAQVETRHGVSHDDKQMQRNETPHVASLQDNKFGPQKTTSLWYIINQYKWSVTREINKTDKSFAWQSRYHDHIIRDEKELYFVDQYIQNNPVNREKNKDKDMFSEFNI